MKDSKYFFKAMRVLALLRKPELIEVFGKNLGEHYLFKIDEVYEGDHLAWLASLDLINQEILFVYLKSKGGRCE